VAVGSGVLVEVDVGNGVGLLVGVLVDVCVGVAVGAAVGVLLGIGVNVDVGVDSAGRGIGVEVIVGAEVETMLSLLLAHPMSVTTKAMVAPDRSTTFRLRGMSIGTLPQQLLLGLDSRGAVRGIAVDPATIHRIARISQMVKARRCASSVRQNLCPTFGAGEPPPGWQRSPDMQTVATIVFGIIALVIVIKVVVPYWRGLSKREREDIVGVCLFLLMVIGVFLCLMAWFIM
jgi:hypothetical protein